MSTTNSKTYDVIVVGLGAVGAATLYQLSLSGKRVLGIDQYSPPHIWGSSHGETRITRQAIGEGEHYVPFALRSHEIWRDIEAQVGTKLLFEIGGLIIGDPDGKELLHGKASFLRRTIDTATKFKISHDILDYSALRSRFPQFNIAHNEIGYFEHGAGYVLPEECIKAQISLAQSKGAEIITGLSVLNVDPNSRNDRAIVRTAQGSFEAEKVIIAAGPWINNLVSGFGEYFKVYRQVLYWFAPKQDAAMFMPDKMPIFIWSFSGMDGDGIYGFPAVGGASGGVKLAREQYSALTTPQTVVREVSKQEILDMYASYVKDKLPLLSEQCVKSASCLYTSTPDSEFVIQRHQNSENIIFASPCSGHGFKHSASIGEALAQLALHGRSKLDVSMFRISNVA